MFARHAVLAGGAAPEAKTGMKADGWPARGLIALGGLLLLLCVLLSWKSLALEHLAGPVVAVEVPRDVRGAKAVTLELAVRAERDAARNNLGAVVRIKRPHERAIEIGRFLPALSSDDEDQSYAFNVAHTIRRLGLAGRRVDIEVVLIHRAGGMVPYGASLRILGAQIAAQ